MEGHSELSLLINFKVMKLQTLIIFSTLFLLSATCLYAEQVLYNEYDVKAAFIYNFAKFTEWPENAISFQNDSLKLCIIGDSPFGTSLKELEGKHVKNKKLLIKHIKSMSSIKGCNMLYISKSEEKNLISIVDYANNYNVLTISDQAGFETKGVVINMFVSEDMIRFNINVDAAKKAGIKISAKLLKLASKVYGVQ